MRVVVDFRSIKRQVTSTLLLAQMHAHAVAQDAEEPGQTRRAPIEVIAPFDRDHQAVLHDFVRRVPTSDGPHGVLEQHRPDEAMKYAESLRIIIFNESEEGLVLERAR